jgi:hypothetical protein
MAQISGMVDGAPQQIGFVRYGSWWLFRCHPMTKPALIWPRFTPSINDSLSDAQHKRTFAHAAPDDVCGYSWSFILFFASAQQLVV